MRLLCSVVVGLVAAWAGVASEERGLGPPGLAPAVATCAAPPPGLVSWWRGEGDATDSASANNGILHNGAGFTSGKVGQAFHFDGVDDFVQAPTEGLPAGGDDRTLQAWVKIESFNPGGESFFAGYGQFGEFARTYHVGSVREPDNLLFFSQWGDGIVGPELRTDQWYHIVATNRSGVVTLYLNGVPRTRRAFFIDTSPGSQFDIGQIPNDAFRRLSGSVDEVAVFNRALSAVESKALYDTGSAGMCNSSAPLRVQTPNTLSKWGLNTRQRLAWTYDGEAPQFEIEVSYDGGRLWDFVGVVENKPGPSQNFFWNVTGPTTSRARLRVTAVGDEAATDVNDANIQIARPYIEVLIPRGTIATGSTQTIFWKHNLGANKPVAIDVSRNGGGSWANIVPNTLTTGAETSSFSWFVDLSPTPHTRIRVRALDGSRVKGTSFIFAVAGS